MELEGVTIPNDSGSNPDIAQLKTVAAPVTVTLNFTSTHCQVDVSPFCPRVRVRSPYPQKETTVSEDTQWHLVAWEDGSPEVSTELDQLQLIIYLL